MTDSQRAKNSREQQSAIFDALFNEIIKLFLVGNNISQLNYKEDKKTHAAM